MNFDLCRKFTFYTKRNTNMERRHCVAGIGIDAYVCHPSIHHRLMNEQCYTQIQLIVDDELCVNLTKLTTLQNVLSTFNSFLFAVPSIPLEMQTHTKSCKATHSSFRLSRHSIRVSFTKNSSTLWKARPVIKCIVYILNGSKNTFKNGISVNHSTQ